MKDRYKHIHTHTHREREREREKWPEINELMLVVLQHFSDVSIQLIDFHNMQTLRKVKKRKKYIYRYSIHNNQLLDLSVAPFPINRPPAVFRDLRFELDIICKLCFTKKPND